MMMMIFQKKPEQLASSVPSTSENTANWLCNCSRGNCGF